MNIFVKSFASIEQATPILIMGTLALISFSFLKSSSIQTPDPVPSTRTSLDYYLNHFSTAQLNEAGHLKSFIRGEYAEHSLATKNTLVRDFLFASSGTHNSFQGKSEFADFNDDANQLILRQNAIINRIPSSLRADEVPTKLSSEHLIFSQYPEKIISETSVEIEQGTRKIHAKSMLYDSDEQKMRLTGNVVAKIATRVN